MNINALPLNAITIARGGGAFTLGSGTNVSNVLWGGGGGSERPGDVSLGNGIGPHYSQARRDVAARDVDVDTSRITSTW